MSERSTTHVAKACAYITRNESELLVFEEADCDGFQIPKGTVEPGESPREATYREAIEESGLAAFGELRHLVTDVWTRRESPPKRYVRHFYHGTVHAAPDTWTHTVTGTGAERGKQFEFRWVELPTDAMFALDLDDYVHILFDRAEESTGDNVPSGITAD